MEESISTRRVVVVLLLLCLVSGKCAVVVRGKRDHNNTAVALSTDKYKRGYSGVLWGNNTARSMGQHLTTTESGRDWNCLLHLSILIRHSFTIEAL